MDSTKHFQISFVGHSLGGLVIRYALLLPLLHPYLNSLNFYLSLNTPHFGLLFGKYWYEMGAKVLARFNTGASIDQLTVNNRDPTENVIYKMAENNSMCALFFVMGVGLSLFKHIYFCSANQDGYAPFHSVRAEEPPSTSGNSSRELEVYHAMLSSFYQNLDKSRITKFDFYYPVWVLGCW